ncbi:class I histocompatibility antigen, F10 alpha chain-like isoform X3 [Paroedura picta]|uniref:class I histocompatibility antigen, F10 alpha chain-like isoform X3 n=1 Tax=Paroedura picta TaxID=143630 RepID=UPI004055A1C5
MGAAVQALALLLLLLLQLLVFLGGVAPVLGGGRPGSSPLHTLHYFKTGVWERGKKAPQYTSLVFMDGQLFGRYNQDNRQCVPQSSWTEELNRNDADFWARSTKTNFASNVIPDLMHLKGLYNQSRGIHTLQVFSGCEQSEDHLASRGFVKYGFNGRDFLSLDLKTLTWTAMDAEADPIKRKWDADRDRGKFWEHFLKDTCVEWLNGYLGYGKEALLRKDPPTVRVTRKPRSDGRETLVCRSHGFYPKEIEVTWRKGEEVWNQETYTGGVVPNSDGTYHTWINIEVDPQERDLYRCHVEHDGLLEPLDLAWEEPGPVPDVGLLVGVVLGVLVALVLVGAAVTFCIRRSLSS